MAEDNRFCHLCEIYKESSNPKLNDRIRLLVDGIDRKEKTPDELYARRLDICASCEKLAGNTCLACGCFVELRAAKKGSVCPYRKWVIR